MNRPARFSPVTKIGSCFSPGWTQRSRLSLTGTTWLSSIARRSSASSPCRRCARRALFAASLEEGGYARDAIMAALAIDKTGLSRLISTATKDPRSHRSNRTRPEGGPRALDGICDQVRSFRRSR
jgi:hypothetical protein